MRRTAQAEGFKSVSHRLVLTQLEPDTLAAIVNGSLTVPGGYPKSWAKEVSAPYPPLDTAGASGAAIGAAARVSSQDSEATIVDQRGPQHDTAVESPAAPLRAVDDAPLVQHGSQSSVAMQDAPVAAQRSTRSAAALPASQAAARGAQRKSSTGNISHGHTLCELLAQAQNKSDVAKQASTASAAEQGSDASQRRRTRSLSRAASGKLDAASPLAAQPSVAQQIALQESRRRTRSQSRPSSAMQSSQQSSDSTALREVQLNENGKRNAPDAAVDSVSLSFKAVDNIASARCFGLNGVPKHDSALPPRPMLSGGQCTIVGRARKIRRV